MLRLPSLLRRHERDETLGRGQYYWGAGEEREREREREGETSDEKENEGKEGKDPEKKKNSVRS